MTENSLEALSASQKQQIQGRAQALARSLQAWAELHPFVRPKRISTLALVVATVLPHLPFDDALLVAKLTLWIFGIDDQIDEQLLPLPEAQRKAQSWRALLGGETNPTSDDELTNVLWQIREQLSASPMFGPLQAHWAGCVSTLVETMVRECQAGLAYHARGPDTLPPLEDYLRDGAHSIGMHLWQSTVLVLVRDASILSNLEQIQEAIGLAGRAIRLYNDVQTFDKEMREGGVNAILILYHAEPEATSLADAKGRVLTLADSYAQKCCSQLKQIGTTTGQFEETTRRLVAFHGSFYRRHDYHTIPTDQVNGLLDSLGVSH